MEFINITGPAVTQNTGLRCSLLYDLYCIVLLSVVFYFNVFFLFAVNFVTCSLRTTILLNLNLNLKLAEKCEGRISLTLLLCERPRV